MPNAHLISVNVPIGYVLKIEINSLEKRRYWLIDVSQG